MLTQLKNQLVQMNAVLLLKSYSKRLSVQSFILLSLDLPFKEEYERYKALDETLLDVIQDIYERKVITNDHFKKLFEIQTYLAEYFPRFFKLNPVSIEEKISMLIGSFEAEKQLQLDVIELNAKTKRKTATNYIAAITFYDQQIIQLGSFIEKLKTNQKLVAQDLQQVDQLYNQLTSMKNHYIQMISELTPFFVKQ